MSHGKTLWLIGFSKAMAEREPGACDPRPSRDRSLRGKARIKARKAARR